VQSQKAQPLATLVSLEATFLMGSMHIRRHDGRARQVGCAANAELAELWRSWIAEATVLASSRQALKLLNMPRRLPLVRPDHGGHEDPVRRGRNRAPAL
jgi:hypothetical protein